MSSPDAETLTVIARLLKEQDERDSDEGDERKRRLQKRSENFDVVPLSLIIAAGSSQGVALDKEGNVVGIKLARVQKSPDVMAKICELKNLQRLVLFSSSDLVVPPEIGELKKLKYVCFGGDFKRLPKELLSLGLPIIGQPKRAERKDRHEYLTEIEQRLTELTGRARTNSEDTSERVIGETLFVKEGHLTRQVEEEIQSLEGIFLQLDRLEDPPLEIAKRGHDAVALYFKERDLGDEPLNELKVILVGNGGSGKTSLVKRILGEKFNPEEPQTHGININPCVVDVDGREVKLHFWDFGGQEIMHATHQFFLSKRSIYILVLDGRKDEDPEYWLQHIESFGGDSPIFLILNRIDEHPAFEVNRRFLKSKYKSIVDFFRVSCAKDIGVKTLVSRLGEELARVPMLQTRWPSSWFAVKQGLESIEKPFLSLEQYRQLCEQERITDATNQELLVDFLHDLGVILHFKDMELLDTHVLDPRWVTEGVYRIINSEIVAKQKGLLHLHQIDKVLSPKKGQPIYSADKHRYIVDLMLKFELCYRIGEQSILVPDLLDIQEPTFDFDDKAALNFIFEFAYLPKSVVPRFIVRMHGDISENMRWRTGVVLKDKAFDAIAVIRADEKAKRIYISAVGQQKRDYFAVIKKVLRDIILSFEKLEITELVPLPDAPDVLLDYREILGHESANRDQIFVGRLGKSYSVQTLLNGIEQSASREAQVVVNVQGNYYAGENITAQSTQIKVEAIREDRVAYAASGWEKVVIYLSGAAFLALVGFLLIRNEPFADPNLVVVLRIIISLVVAIFGASIPGMLQVDFSAKGITIRALGALALFVIAFVLTPTVLP